MHYRSRHDSACASAVGWAPRQRKEDKTVAERYAIGLDIGGTNIKAIAIGASGRVLDDRERPTVDDERAQWKADAKQLIAEMEAAVGRPADAVGVACPGIIAPHGRSVWWMLGKMEPLMGFEWGPYLGRHDVVPVYNDAKAALLGEASAGAAKGSQNVVLLTLGTGVGGAALCDGRLLNGHMGRAGHLGHMSVHFDGPPDLARTPGAIEYEIGQNSVAQRSGGKFEDTKALVEAYRNGDAVATEVWLRSVRALAAHIVSVVNALDPEIVIVGGGIAKSGAALFTPLNEYLDEFEWRPFDHRVRLVEPTLGADAGAIGAAYGALRGDGQK
jgi:glucokinase